MKAKATIKEKLPIIIIYILITAVVTLISMMLGGGQTGSGVTLYFHNSFLSFSIFVLLTAVQMLLYHFGKQFGLVKFVAIFCVSLTKFVAAFFLELALDYLNISFGSRFKIVSSTLMISFMALLLLAAVAEIIVLIRINRRAERGAKKPAV